MGYTNYWYIKETFSLEEWDKVKKVATALLKDNHDIAGWEGQSGTEPEIDDSTITFNGVGDDSHETFLLIRDVEQWEKDMGRQGRADPEFGHFFFCKTARKPYDEQVWKILCAARNSAPEKIKIDNDGAGDVSS
tara:strand:+ start:1397 stop:1798 length:402 start_codon:yes stop_codon:yes gene_type:complete